MDRSMLLAAADHLWQSTLFAAAVGALTLLFRRNRASLRHALWLIASLKFLVPFSLLTAIGARFPLDPFWQSAPHGASDVAAPSGIAPPWLTMLDDVAAPLAPSQSNAAAVSVLAQPEASAGVDMGAIIGALWLLGTLAVLLFWCLRWIGVRRALRGATPIDLPFCVPVKRADSLLEPGIVGIFRQVLLLPKGIEQRLSPSQFHAVLAHEQCHVQRRDNLLAALHMFVEAAFWFHPLVWWIGARLVAERERACDEHVIRAGHASDAYAEGILNVCQHYLESKLPIVSGVSGADLRQRIERVVGNIPVVALGSAKKGFLVVASCVALVLPIAIGCFTSPVVSAQASPEPYESIVIRQTPAAARRSFMMIYWPFSGSLEIENRTLRQIIAFAYDVDESSISGPDSLATHYDIRATVEPDFDKPFGGPTDDEIQEQRQKLQLLLASRFGLVVKRAASVRAGFALKVADTGSRLQEQKSRGSGYIDYFPNGIHANAQSLPWFVEQLAERLGAPVRDETQLRGTYAFNLAWGPESGRNEPPPLATPVNVTVLESALHDQMGLTLEPRAQKRESILVESVRSPRSDPLPDYALVSQSVTIRLSPKNLKGTAMGIEPRRNSVVYRNAPFRNVIGAAYGINRISGTEWLDEPHVDVYIKGAPGWQSTENLLPRGTSRIIREALEEKFGIVVERKQVDVTGYAMKLAPGGLKATPTSPNTPNEMGSGSKNAIYLKGYTLDHFAQSMGYTRGPLVNETGLAGTYDFQLSWGPQVPVTDPTPAVPMTDEKFREVLRDQAGLLLEPRKSQIEELEVIKMKPPSEVLPLTM